MTSAAGLLHYEVLLNRCSLVLGFLHAGFLLVLLPAPAALGQGFAPLLPHDGPS